MTVPVPVSLRLAWILLWTAHAVGAAGWWWLMAQGFPPGHPKFFANLVIPAAVFAVSMLGLFAALRANGFLLNGLAAFPLVFWMMLGGAWYQHSPLSIRYVGPLLLPLLLLLMMAWFWTRRGRGGMTLLSFTATLAAVGCGVGFAYAQRGVDKAASPYKNSVFIVLPDRGAQVDAPAAERPFKLDAENAQLSVQHNGVSLHILPILTFMSRSPDRTWSRFAPPNTNNATRQLMGLRETTEQATARYMSSMGNTGEGQSALIVSWDGEKLPFSLEAITGLEKPVYSHLNQYCILSLKGLKTPRIAFSPCAEKPIDMQPHAPPARHPVRFAYVSAQKTFHVAEAQRKEKGPFTELASGPHDPATPLTLTFLDGETPKLKVTLLDFTAQAGTVLSPTAGWGMPVNAVEFSLDDSTGTVTVWFTLAGTGIGRGWDTVGHPPGTYRNRMKVEAP